MPARWVDGDGQPRFALNEYFVWQQPFPAKGSVQIRHTYTPSLSTGVPQPAAICWSPTQKTPASNRPAKPACSAAKASTVWGWPTCVMCSPPARTGTARSRTSS
ncbi:DUF4424 domain-containing protein [Xanthomonas vasicola]|uniref:DUF4424 domain-containing protein n=1 Tax=Xanthomonas vasicola TaxID=56459 RepID=A0ABD7S8Z8_XANVA|nr:DUF4424 domain-containing protein [Xanthomonas vasicola]TWQ52285.1 DUF4424 domain-containing protein [Xanthomonas vasicola]TWQ55981.1 DUF4424 domain-containing protein [Xanthomonas vasicola]TWQ69958.1 DUF4424 domain-containing protein [Xanthomonas vasicola]TWR02210.1 DUF4424 domain-containing protein [Xanthomonas vasicola]